MQQILLKYEEISQLRLRLRAGPSDGCRLQHERTKKKGLYAKPETLPANDHHDVMLPVGPRLLVSSAQAR
jgi:hypothetical protein